MSKDVALATELNYNNFTAIKLMGHHCTKEECMSSLKARPMGFTQSSCNMIRIKEKANCYKNNGKI